MPLAALSLAAAPFAAVPMAFILALTASLLIHAAVLLGAGFAGFDGHEERPPPLRAELRPPPARPPAPPAKPEPDRVMAEKKKTASKQTPGPRAPTRRQGPVPAADRPLAPLAPLALPAQKPAVLSEPASPEGIAPDLPPMASEISTARPEPAEPILPARGVLRFAIYYGTDGLQVGRAEHRWEFTADGRYRLSGLSKTVGLVALFKSVEFENESIGRLVPGGLQPERYRTRKNGQEGNENADFMWSTGVVRLSRDGSVREVAPGTQDILSLNYQLAYLPRPELGSRIGVVTGKKYERYDLDSLGEEILETPAGIFRTLHLRAMTDSTTEIWIALDQHRLPVKIRFADRKGDIYEQVVTEIGMNDDSTSIRSRLLEGEPPPPNAAPKETAP